jgi:anti-anti-sigma factor
MAEPGPGELRCEVVARAPHECLLRVAGEVDLATAQGLADFMAVELARAAAGCRVVVDLSRIVFFSAAGVRALVTAAEHAGRRDVVLVPHPVSTAVAAVLELCGVGLAVGGPAAAAPPASCYKTSVREP